MNRYLHLFTVDSETKDGKKYRISIDKEKTKNADNTIVLSCNCPAYVFKKEKGIGQICKHVEKTWEVIQIALTRHGINSFTTPNMLASENRGWMISNSDWLNDSPVNHLGEIKKVGSAWKITNPFVSFSVENLTQRIRMCCSCDFPQEIPLDKRTFSCQSCGRLQRI